MCNPDEKETLLLKLIPLFKVFSYKLSTAIGLLKLILSVVLSANENILSERRLLV